MTLANFAWRKKEIVEAGSLLEEGQTSQFHPAFLKICTQRGINTLEKLEQFVSSNPQLFHDPFLMYDMDRAVERIHSAVEAGEEILIFGDYDADGITSTTILVETLENIGAHVHYYLPDRFTDGYGPNKQVFDYYINAGISLIITVDCGVAAHEAVAFAMDKQVDVIVTDHHELPIELPKAYAIIHPRHPLGSYPFGDLSGAGVALKVATALLNEIPYELMEVAAIGTVADLVSLTDENRTIVKQGLHSLQQTQRVGLLELFEQLELNAQTISSTTLGFVIGPRFNALGRMGDATPGVELLLTFAQDEAKEIVKQMNRQNTLRQETVERIVTEAMEQIDQQKDVLVHVLVGNDWHEGVLGIVASKMVEVTKRPTIVFTKTEQDGVLKGSARSIESFNIFTALQQVSEQLLKFGGHHMAAGLSLKQTELDDFKKQLNRYAQTLKDEIKADQPVTVDLSMTLAEIDVTLIEQLQLLEPFGVDNAEPIVMINDVTLKNTKVIGGTQKHLKASIANEEDELQMIGFYKGHWVNELMPNAKISTIGTLSINEWQGNKLAQLIVKDIRKEGKQFFDWRTSTIRAEHFQVNHAIYVVNTNRVKQAVQEKINSTSQVVLWEEVDDQLLQTPDKKALIIVECPTVQSQVEHFIEMEHALDLYIIAYLKESAMTVGMPTREQFAVVYRYLKQHPKIALGDKLEQLATYLSLNQAMLRFILNVFAQTEIIQTKQGVVTLNTQQALVSLEESALMVKRREQMWLEKVFVYSNFTDLVKWLTQGKELQKNNELK